MSFHRVSEAAPFHPVHLFAVLVLQHTSHQSLQQPLDVLETMHAPAERAEQHESMPGRFTGW